MLSYRKLAMCVLGRPLHTGWGIDSPRSASQRAAAFILTAAMLTTLAAPAFAGTWYIEDGDITVKAGETEGTNKVSQGANQEVEDTDTIITNREAKASSNTVTIEAEKKDDKVEVTLKDVNIDTSSRNKAAVSVTGSGNTTIKLDGDNHLTGGNGIYSNSSGSLTISGDENDSLTAQGGDSRNGIYSVSGDVTISGGTVTATGGNSTGSYGSGGDGIHSGSVVKISGDTITKATGGNATGENSTGGSGIGGSFVNIAGGTINTTGGSGKSGGAGVSTESGIVSIGNSDTPLDLTATAPDADNAIRGRDGKKLDEIIHLKENGKRGLVKLVENGVTRLFHNGVYTKSIYPAGSETHPLGDWVITKKPTCTEKGERQRSCTVEHCVVTETEELPALGHQWSGWMPVQGDSSREYRICAVCNEVEYRDVSHNSGISDSTISTGLRVLDPAQADILQNAQLVRLNQISDVLYIDVTHETASLQGVLSDLTGLRSERIGTIVFSTERCTSTLSLSDVAALGAGDTPFTLRHSGSTASFTVGGADHSALLR